jgi:hypothetical protein
MLALFAADGRYTLTSSGSINQHNQDGEVGLSLRMPAFTVF